MKKALFLIITANLLLLAGAPRAFAQEPQEPDIDKIVSNQIENLTKTFKLDEIQVFYVDSILNHDYKAMQAELKVLQDQKVSNTDMYYDIQYKWQDSIYEAFQKIFDEDQWAKYLKTGAARDKKTRDKKRAK